MPLTTPPLTSPCGRFGLILMREEQNAGLSFVWKRDESHGEQEPSKAIKLPGLFSRLPCPSLTAEDYSLDLGFSCPPQALFYVPVWFITTKDAILTTSQCPTHSTFFPPSLLFSFVLVIFLQNVPPE